VIFHGQIFGNVVIFFIKIVVMFLQIFGDLVALHE
jgi:hypothetical protein